MLTRQHFQHHTNPHHQKLQVIKVGGENASDPRTATWLASMHGSSHKVIPVISALRTKPLNTTTELIRAREAFSEDGMTGALPILDNLFKIHLQTLKESGMSDQELEHTLRGLFEDYFPKDLKFPLDLVRENPGYALEQRFIGYGEVMSAHVLGHLLTTRYQVENAIINTPIQGKKGVLGEILKVEVSQGVQATLQAGKLPIVPGYQTVYGQSILANYGRGYTDKIAERVAVGLSDLGQDVELHVQKQLPLLSSNPNTLTNTKIIRDLSYWSAAEITGARGANAQVLNEHTISRELSASGIPVHVYNPFEKSGGKSIISREGASTSQILFVDGRQHVSTITLSGFHMSAPGILAKASEILAKNQISVDSIASSETEVTLTTYKNISEFEKSEILRGFTQVLGAEYEFSVANNLGMIYCIGDNLGGHPGILESITGTLAREGIDIECVSQSRGQRSITLGVASKDLARGIEAIHKELIED